MERVLRLAEGRTVELWLCAAGLLVAGYTALMFGTLPGEESAGEMIGTFGVLILVPAAYIRYYAQAVWFAPSGAESAGRVRKPLFLYFLPAGVTIMMLPVIMAGALDPEMSGVGSLFLFLLLAYACPLLGALLVPFVLVPLEWLGRGLLRTVTGKPDGGPLLLGGALLGMLTTFIVVGALALEDLPPAYLAHGPIIAALLGIDGPYTVASPTLLWVARGLALVLIAAILALSRVGRAERDRVRSGRS